MIGGFLMLCGGANCCLRGIKQGKLWGKGALFAELPIIGKGQLAGAADHSMVAVVPEQQLVGGGDISLRRFVPQRRIKVPTSSIAYKKEPADDSSSTGLSV